MSILNTVLLSLICATSVCAIQPRLTILDLEDKGIQVGKKWTGSEDVRNLSQTGFNLGSIRGSYFRSCPEGLWMGYEEVGFAGHSYFMHVDLNGESERSDKCIDMSPGVKLKSVKIVGSHLDSNAPAVVTYSLKWHEGKDTAYLKNDQRSHHEISQPFHSLILVGSEEIELLTNPPGFSVCVQPNKGHIHNWKTFQTRTKSTLKRKYDFTHLANMEPIFGTNQFTFFKFGCTTKSQAIFDKLMNFKFE